MTRAGLSVCGTELELKESISDFSEEKTGKNSLKILNEIGSHFISYHAAGQLCCAHARKPRQAK